MSPFEFVILFFSFIYALALTHLLYAWTRMIRHRRELVFSWPHFLWMLTALVYAADNWLSSWDFRGESRLTLLPLGSLLLFTVTVYFECALVSPDFEGGEGYDMKRFHEREGPTYIAVVLVTLVSAIAANSVAGTAMNVTNWLDENKLVIAMIVPPAAALIVKRRWIQVLAPAAMLAMSVAYVVIYYPVLTK